MARTALAFASYSSVSDSPSPVPSASPSPYPSPYPSPSPSPSPSQPSPRSTSTLQLVPAGLAASPAPPLPVPVPPPSEPSGIHSRSATDGFLTDDWLAAHIIVDARVTLAEMAVRETGDLERIRQVVGALERAMRVRAALYDLRWRLEEGGAKGWLSGDAPPAIYVAATHLWSRDLVDELCALAEHRGSDEAWEEARRDVGDGAEMYLFACLDPLFRDVEEMGASAAAEDRAAVGLMVRDAARLKKHITALCDSLA